MGSWRDKNIIVIWDVLPTQSWFVKYAWSSVFDLKSLIYKIYFW